MATEGSAEAGWAGGRASSEADGPANGRADEGDRLNAGALLAQGDAAPAIAPSNPPPKAGPLPLEVLLGAVPCEHAEAVRLYVEALRAAGWGEKRVREHVAGILSLEAEAVDQVLALLDELAARPPAAGTGPPRRSTGARSLGAAEAPQASLPPVDAERFALHVRHTYLRTDRDRQRDSENLAREVVAMKARAEERARRKKRRERDGGEKPRRKWSRVTDPSPSAAFARRTRDRGYRREGTGIGEGGAVAAAAPTGAMPSAREALPQLDGPLPSLDELLALVGPEYREHVAFYLRDLDVGGWSVEERAKHLALILRLPVERRATALFHLASLRNVRLDAAIISQQIAHLFLRPPEQAVFVARALGEGGSTGTGPRGPYSTQPRGRLGAAVVEHVGITTAEAAREAGVRHETARIALNDFERLGLVVRTRRQGKPDTWHATVELVTLIFQMVGGSQEFAMGSTLTDKGQTHGEFLGARPSEVLEQQHKAYKRLKAMGMEDRLALRTVRKHRFDFVNRQIANVEKYAREGKVESMGALLNFRFWGKNQEQRRHIGLATKVVPEKLRAAYREATKNAPLSISIHLAYKLKKMQDNGKELEPWDVWGTLNDIRKEDDNRQARQGA